MQCYVLNSDQWFTDRATISVTSLWHAFQNFVFLLFFAQTHMKIVMSVLFVCPAARACPSLYLSAHIFQFENQWIDLDEFLYERHAIEEPG
jgi:hypothetical protein